MERREEWTYIETKHAAEIDCGEFELRPGWNGILDASELRRLLQRAVTEHNQHAALVEQRDLLVAALREITARLGESITVSDLGDEAVYVMRVIRDMAARGRAALATVEQGEGA